jgi:hypothetical protein
MRSADPGDANNRRHQRASSFETALCASSG